jgi:peptide/nickel transport system ATP-binding protein
MQQPPLVTIQNLTVAFRGAVALHGIDLHVRPGESLGLVGESGCGKSVTWLAALGLLPRSATVAGSVRLDGQELLGAPPAALDRIRGGRVAMIFQDPASALNPVHRIGRQVAEAVSLHRGLSGASARAEALRLLDQVGIPGARARMDAYPHEMSGGQNQRVMIAAALAGQPELLIADEPTTALDVTIQAQILDLLQRLREELGMALVLISHDLGVVADMCDRVCVMYAGRIVEEADANALFDHPAHPYATGLLGALPPLTGPRRRLEAIPGRVPEPWAMPPGCAFAPRCSRRTDACDATVPGFRAIAPGHRAACIRAEAA